VNKWSFQDKAVEAILNDIVQGFNPVLIMATGTGKTHVFSRVVKKCAEMGIKSLVNAHTEELINQAIDKIYKITGIIPDKEQAEYWASNNSQIVVGSVKTMQKKRLERWNKEHFGLIVVDECFTGGTYITTIDGFKTIDKIKIGDQVLSSDHKYHKVYKIIKKKPDSLCTVKIGSNKITCTTNHLFFTQRGWVKASKLESVDMVCRKDYHKNYEDKYMYSMPERSLAGLKSEKGFIQKIRQILLFRRMQKRIQTKNIFRNYGKNKQEICLRKNEKKQSHVERRNKKKSIRNIEKNEFQTKSNRWKRKRFNNSSKNIIRKTWLGNRISNKNKRRKNFRISNLLQSRYWKSRIKNSNRSGWKFSFYFGKTNSRQKENKVFEWIRVDSVKIHKQRSDGKFTEMLEKDFVYDLSINSIHNYFANNTLVHNCHHAVTPTYMNILNHFEKYNLLGVTATPDRADEKELGQVFNKISFEYPLHQAIRDGILVNIIGKKVTDLDIDLTEIRVSGKDYSDTQLGEVLLKYIIPLANSIKKETEGMKTLIFMPDVKSSAVMAEQLRRLEIDADYLSGDRKKERGPILYDFKVGKISHLVSCNILLEGFDEPSIESIVMLRPTSSRALYSQAIGRGTRLFKEPEKKGSSKKEKVGRSFKRDSGFKIKENLYLIEFSYNYKKLKLVQPYELFASKLYGGEIRDQAALTGSNDTDLLKTLEAAREVWEKPENLTKRLITKEYGFQQFDPFSVAELFNSDISGEFDINYQGKKLSGTITPGQIDILNRYGVHWDELDKAQASRIINLYSENGYYPMKDKATRNQKYFLTTSGYKYDKQLMKAQASVIINMVKSGKLNFKN